MKEAFIGLFICLTLIFLVGMADQAGAEVFTQCPPDTDGIDTDGDGDADNDNVCVHLSAGDGFVTMADGKPLYIFGFGDMDGFADADIMTNGMLAAEFAAPTIRVREGQRLYITLSNAGMAMRPDLFDPHTVHFHGYGNAAPIFDGEPMGSFAIKMGFSLTYFYNINAPGTYMYHCHVEATEHMQMGMLGNLYVLPKQNMTMAGKFVYNDGDGTTAYDREYPIQMQAFDPIFHDKSLTIQPLPFALLKDTYPMLNGRGYPDTVNPLALPVPMDGGVPLNNGTQSQKVSALIEANTGDQVLLRISSLSTIEYFTLSSLGIPMRVVGQGARISRGTDGTDLSYMTSSVTLGGGESTDVILDTAGIAPGTYFLYTTNLNHLSNDTEDYGGMMTEIIIHPGGTLPPQAL